MSKVKKIKVDYSDTIIPAYDNADSGKIGRWIEEDLKQRNFPIDTAATVDMPVFGVEVKSRRIDSNAAHTVGGMTLRDIIDTHYDQSPIKQKMQQQFRVSYDANRRVVVDASVVDYSAEDVQQKIKSAYEAARSKANPEHSGDLKGNEFGYFEDKGNGTYAFRIPNSGMKKLTSMAQSEQQFQRFFDTA